MSKFTSPLNNVKIASPCSADWEQMFGDARKRYCGDCKLNVYNLSAMSREDAENLVTQSEGRLCVRFYQRADGTVITQDCPVGWAAVKHRAKVVTTAFFSLMLALLTGSIFASMFSSSGRGGVTVGEIKAYPTPPPPNTMTMGAVSINPNKTPKSDDDRRAKMGEIRLKPKKRTMTEVEAGVDAPVVERTM